MEAGAGGDDYEVVNGYLVKKVRGLHVKAQCRECGSINTYEISFRRNLNAMCAVCPNCGIHGSMPILEIL